MILVLADDLSGAAELAGAALRHGFTAEVQTKYSPDSAARVVCVDTNTRSLSAAEAARVVNGMAARAAAANPEWIYKKCDSVLRGNVLVEIRAIMAAAGHAGAMLVSANPSRGRVIRGGEYFVDGRPLHTTLFAADPEHPRKVSRVAELLAGDLSGVATPDAETTAALEQHALGLKAGILPAGGVEFFEAILKLRVNPPLEAMQIASSLPEGVTLMVCGSAAAWERRRKQAAIRGIPALTLPFSAAEVTRALTPGRSVLLGIGSSNARPAQTPRELADQLARAVSVAWPAAGARRLMLEGGATASAVLREAGWQRLRACHVTAPGIGALEPIGGGPLILIKPGSYEWPDELWPNSATGDAK